MHSPCAPQLGGVCADEIDGIIATLEQRVHRLEEVQDEAKREMLGNAIGKEEECWVSDGEDDKEEACWVSNNGDDEEEACWVSDCEDEGTTPRLRRHRPEDLVETRDEAWLPVTVKTPTYWSPAPRAGVDNAPPRESKGVTFVGDETSSGYKSAQGLDYSYNCEYLWLDSFGCGFHNKTSTAIVPP